MLIMSYNRRGSFFQCLFDAILMENITMDALCLFDRLVCDISDEKNVMQQKTYDDVLSPHNY